MSGSSKFKRRKIRLPLAKQEGVDQLKRLLRRISEGREGAFAIFIANPDDRRGDSIGIHRMINLAPQDQGSAVFDSLRRFVKKVEEDSKADEGAEEDQPAT